MVARAPFLPRFGKAPGPEFSFPPLPEMGARGPVGPDVEVAIYHVESSASQAKRGFSVAPRLQTPLSMSGKELVSRLSRGPVAVASLYAAV